MRAGESDYELGLEMSNHTVPGILLSGLNLSSQIDIAGKAARFLCSLLWSEMILR